MCVCVIERGSEYSGFVSGRFRLVLVDIMCGSLLGWGCLLVARLSRAGDLLRRMRRGRKRRFGCDVQRVLDGRRAGCAHATGVVVVASFAGRRWRKMRALGAVEVWRVVVAPVRWVKPTNGHQGFPATFRTTWAPVAAISCPFAHSPPGFKYKWTCVDGARRLGSASHLLLLWGGPHWFMRASVIEPVRACPMLGLPALFGARLPGSGF